jgi:hypothetical protein
VVGGVKCIAPKDKYEVIEKLRGDTVEFFDVHPSARKYDLLRSAGTHERLLKLHP